MAKRRTDEAVSRKCEEFRRGIRSYNVFMSKWLEKAEIPGECRGKRAYAYKQAEMWKIKAERMEKAYNSVRRADTDRDQLDHTRVRLPFTILQRF